MHQGSRTLKNVYIGVMTPLVKALLAQPQEQWREREPTPKLFSVLIILYCYDKIPWPRQLVKERVHLDFWFQEDKNPSWPRRDRHGCRDSKLRTHISNHKQEADRAKLEAGEAFHS